MIQSHLIVILTLRYQTFQKIAIMGVLNHPFIKTHNYVLELRVIFRSDALSSL